MGNFCNKCGEKLLAGAAFCPKCGNKLTKLDEVSSTVEHMESQEIVLNKNKGYKVKLVIAFVAVMLLFVLARQFLNGGNNSVEGPVKNFLDGMVNGDVDKILKSFPKSVANEFSEDNELVSQVKEYKSYLKDVEYKIIERRKLEGAELREVIDSNNDMKVKAAFIVKVEITAKLFGEKYTQDLDFTVIKVGTKYYVVEGGFL